MEKGCIWSSHFFIFFLPSCMSEHLTQAHRAAETQWDIHGHIWIPRSGEHVPTEGKNVPNHQDVVCGLLVLPFHALNRWCFCWPIKSNIRPRTDGGLSFVAAWKESSAAAAIVFPHMGVAGTAR